MTPAKIHVIAIGKGINMLFRDGKTVSNKTKHSFKSFKSTVTKRIRVGRVPSGEYKSESV